MLVGLARRLAPARSRVVLEQATAVRCRHQQDALTVKVLRGHAAAPVMLLARTSATFSTMQDGRCRGLRGGIELLVLLLLERAKILEILQQLQH